MNEQAVEPTSVMWLRRTIALFALVLFGSTWVLWSPQTTFPQIPLIAAFGSLPSAIDWTTLAAMLAAMLFVMFTPRSTARWQVTGLLFVAAFTVSALIDQHRLQPWAYQFAVMVAILSLVPNERGLKFARILTISLYLHSALSKFDLSFFESHGQYLVGGLTKLAGIDLEKWSPELRRNVAVTLPIAELVVAIGLCFRASRRMALVGSVAMHALLIAALGPWSLNHELAVLIWNGYFIVQNIILFGTSPNARDASPESIVERGRARTVLAAFILALAALLPFLEPFGFFDVWPSWGLYASRPARVRVFVERDAREQVPVSLRRYVQEARFTDELSPLRIDRWSLATTRAPIYPQARFELGVALAVARIPNLGERIHVEIESAADRWTGKRTTRKVSGVAAIQQEANSFWLNASPRRAIAIER